jgi:beta-phosphoglucomutase-like phosphatase (HAD superfamily)
MVTADDVQRVKPDPDLERAATSALGVAPATAVALEDVPNGVLAAKRAGLWAVAVPNALTCTLPWSHADLRLASLADVPRSVLLEQLTRLPEQVMVGVAEHEDPARRCRCGRQG